MFTRLSQLRKGTILMSTQLTPRKRKFDHFYLSAQAAEGPSTKPQRTTSPPTITTMAAAASPRHPTITLTPREEQLKTLLLSAAKFIDDQDLSSQPAPGGGEEA